MSAEVRAAVACSRALMPSLVKSVGELVRIPSVSTAPAHAGDVRRAASWLVARLRGIGFSARCVPTARHPAVVASWRGARGCPTLLVYGHYDVQPAEPLSEWSTPPFSPVVRGDRLYGRGASDDKGQLLAHVGALQSWLAATGRLPVNVVCLFEGEEEIGSPNLASLLVAHADELRADVAVLSDTAMQRASQPTITYALRGLLACEVEVRGAVHDNHSGTYGGAIANPLEVLASVVASLHDSAGRLAVRGMLSSVSPPPAAERAALRRDGPSDRDVLSSAGASAGWGEGRLPLFERTVARPSLSVTGIAGGWGGQGVKGVIPARAVAKVSIRLVPSQSPSVVFAALRAHCSRLPLPPGVRLSVRCIASAPPVTVDPRHPAMHAATAACLRGFGHPPVLLRSGGTIPAVHLFREHLGIPTVLLAFGLRDDRIHAADEHLHLPTFARGVRTAIHFLDQLAASSPVTLVRVPQRHALAPAGTFPWEPQLL